MKRIEYFVSIPEAERIFGKEQNLSSYEFCGYYRLIREACGSTSRYPENSLSIKEIDAFLKTMNERRRLYIKLRCWDCLSLREISKEMAISPQRAQQIQKKVLARANKRFSLETIKTALEGKKIMVSLIAQGRESECKLTIQRLNLSERCLNALLRAHLDTIGKVIVKSDCELLKIRNFGKTYMTELDEKLQRYFGVERHHRNCSDLEALKIQLKELVSKNEQYKFKAGLEVLQFSSRTNNVLRRAKINTIGELLSKSDEELLRIRSLGPFCFKEIDEKLKQYLGVERRKEDYENIRQKFAGFLNVGKQHKFDEPIESLSLSTRPYRSLKYNGINTIGELLSKDRETLLEFAGMGRVSVNEIVEKIYKVLNYIMFD